MIQNHVFDHFTCTLKTSFLKHSLNKLSNTYKTVIQTSPRKSQSLISCPGLAICRYVSAFNFVVDSIFHEKPMRNG